MSRGEIEKSAERSANCNGGDSWKSIESRIRMSSADPTDVENWAVVVDESPEALLIIAKALKSFCMSVHPFLSPAEALQFLKDCDELQLKKVRAVFSSFELPEMNGLELLNEIRDDSRLNKVPVVVSSQSDESELQSQIKTQRLQGHVSRPVTTESIVERMMALSRLPKN